MKTSSLAFTLVLVTPLLAFAGGNTSIVELDRVASVEIEDERIVIVGSGMIRKRVMSDAEHGNGTAFGQPVQWFHAKVRECKFEIIPYHLRSDVRGVPGLDPDKVTPEQRAQSMQWWADTLATARKIRVGVPLTIGYQREKMTISSVYVTHIVGSGSLEPQPREKPKQGNPTKPPQPSTAAK